MATPPRLDTTVALTAILAVGSPVVAVAQAADGGGQRSGIGSTPSEDLVQAWDIDISPSGDNLPKGSGSVSEGKEIFASTCAACHGEDGVSGTIGGRLVGGRDSLASGEPVKTVGSYWPYATTLYDYIHRAMPFDEPQSLTPDQVYAVSACVLNLDGIIPDDAVMDSESLPNVEMPNRDGFERMDTVTSTRTTDCMQDCTPLEVSR